MKNKKTSSYMSGVFRAEEVIKTKGLSEARNQILSILNDFGMGTGSVASDWCRGFTDCCNHYRRLIEEQYNF